VGDRADPPSGHLIAEAANSPKGDIMAHRILVLYGSYRTDRLGIRLARYVVRELNDLGADAR
jgi:hypothetical protein